jgi:uncharacterized membrane protein
MRKPKHDTIKHEQENFSTKREVVKAEGKHREIVTIYDLAGNILHKVATPLKLEFHPKDLVQIVVGSTLLAVPVSYTEEVWVMGKELPIENVVGIGLLSLLFVSVFVYYSFYRHHFYSQWDEFIKRTIAIYAVSFIMVGVILTLIDKAPWAVDHVIALKRITLVAFPASMSAAVANMIS